MKREIKFRAWDKYSKDPKNHKMVYPNNGDFISWHAPSNWKSCYYVMQYTGLKDKNRNEIYEGDILLDTLTKCLLIVRFGHNRNGGYNGWFAEYINIDRNGFSAINGDYGSDINSQIEVIGNIYENPELLNQ